MAFIAFFRRLLSNLTNVFVEAFDVVIGDGLP